MDLRRQPLLRRDRVDLRPIELQRLRAALDLPLDHRVDLVTRREVVPQAVDLVQDHDAGVAARLRDVLSPDLDVRLRDAGVRREDEQHRVRVRDQVQRELGLGADRVQARRVEDDEPLREQRMREVHDRVPPHRDLDGAVGIGHRTVVRILVVVEAVALRLGDRHALRQAHLGKARRREPRTIALDGARELEAPRAVFLEFFDEAVHGEAAVTRSLRRPSRIRPPVMPA